MAVALYERTRFGVHRPPVWGHVRAWRPTRLGPSFEWLDNENLRIQEGKLAGQEFRFECQLRPGAGFATLHQHGQRVVELRANRDAIGDVVLRDALVREDLRGAGLCAVITWCMLRELLYAQESSAFRMRLSTAGVARPDEGLVRSVGAAVLAARLGFTTEVDIARLLSQDRVADLGLVTAGDGSPRGVRVILRGDSEPLVAVVLSPDTMKPRTDFRHYNDLATNAWLIDRCAKGGTLVFLNADHVLVRENVSRFVSCLAVDPEEAQFLHKRVRGV